MIEYWRWQLEPMFGEVCWTITYQWRVVKQGFAPTHAEAQAAALAAIEEAEKVLPRIIRYD